MYVVIARAEVDPDGVELDERRELQGLLAEVAERPLVDWPVWEANALLAGIPD